MGQTQLLMIVLAVIIVGIAVAVGITQFGESAVAANRDAVAGDCHLIVAKAQQWYRKPTSLGGGGNAFTGLTLADIGVSSSNQNGSYALTIDAANQITIVGTGNESSPTTGSALTVTVEYFAANDSTSYLDDM